MPRQNRVTPFSEIISTAARGTLMGNRGCLHNDRGEIRRQYQLKRWIICVLDFKDRHRPIMTPGHYTELFFLDEATALAAGHRPCAECQRDRYNIFRRAFAKANPAFGSMPRLLAPMIDEALHHERTTSGGQRLLQFASVETLPDGSFVKFDDDENAYLVKEGSLWRWSPFGYERTRQLGAAGKVNLLTPPLIVRTLMAGFKPAIHYTAL